MTKEQAREKIAALVEVYEEHHESYHSHAYDEAKVRVDFINKFFKALGWDIDNEEGYAEAYREVILEDKLRIGGNVKAPDYGFTIGGNKQRKFYVEAKKPTVTLKTDKEAAWQLRNYGWNASATVSILTNFAEFAVYDCGKRPKKDDSAGIGRIKYFTYNDYLEQFDFIWDTFSKEGVLKGRFDKFVQAGTDRRGTATVDKAFLESLNEWRKYIATSIAKNNHKLSEEEIGFVVQQTLDRIIFLRFCEDRGVESYGSLKSAMKQGELYRNLFSLFKEADHKYNSGLFDFKKDKLSENAVIDNKVIKSVITDLYPPDSEYNFSVLPVEILGNAYEQFLGKVIRVTPGHVVKIDDKPEVRKAGGVYYTPQYIVNYIVEHTVGELIKGKTPKQIEEIKIVDPACGSGSFLLGAFEYLMDYHTKYYIDKATATNVSSPLVKDSVQVGERGSNTGDSKKKDEPGVLDFSKLSKGKLTPDGRLTSAEKKRILTNNIYGVDIDTQAVEVTKLSLLLKAMEGETSASVSHQLTITHERILPNLDNNIRCGNSLIGPDFYDSELELEPEEERKVNAFDWKQGFPKVFNKGGFDVVIGNPPYVGRSTSFEESEKKYIKNNFSTSEGKYELYQLFIEKGTKISNLKGAFISLITPQTWLSIVQSTKLRKYLINNFSVEEIVFLGKDVFNAAVDTIIFLLKTGNSTRTIAFKAGKYILDKNEESVRYIDLKNIERENFIIPISMDNESSTIIKKVKKDSIPLSDIGYWSDGVKIVGKAKEFAFQSKKVDNTFYPMYSGGDIGRYTLHWGGLYCCRDKAKIIKHKATDIRLRDEEVFKRIKIIVRKTGSEIIACIDENKYYYEQSLFSFALEGNLISLKLILALLNSNIGKYFLRNNAFSRKETFPQIRLHWLKEFPIPVISRQDKRLQDEIIKNVELLLKLNETKQQTKLQSNTEQLNTRIAHSEQRIDELVYELYDLTKEEIEIVEKETKNP